MAFTVIGLFDEAQEAQQAVDQLVNNGFARTSIDLSARTGRDSESDDTLFPDRHTNTSGSRTEELVDDTKDVGSGIGGFFSSLFGDDDEDKHKYNQVADQRSLVTVHASTEEEARQPANPPPIKDTSYGTALSMLAGNQIAECPSVLNAVVANGRSGQKLF